MNLRRIVKPLSAILLTAGLLTVGVVAPADAGTTGNGASTHDTGWGRMR